ncbi:putative armadillo-like helical, pumilio domain-containing protein [Helianthus annuus]|uniref:Armadillo-like helical, pumilio domain-containing protein n=2 Tax=Helianthus annuus TaxID=4232 RepID=A0A9K3NPB9_HELAN|nr:pumilio homolog 12 [Helianthus annuus]KAF5806513.1 putative armadillo-like helical, pumilio domain-containing protein [Helianthus annuus]KAJ0570776.1 putative armadillo-like helical, pumilio domain-containing protein [Helianthus annuus]KAJ0577720.1 putative armadillo-like helical, pumilio domain-containing protein [Helianthus annuus]KAJ0585117.1 putative armadillo-like helical, pumilio domain-containing protein [Helianthus annuus]KAJ0747668.1 putative armadillo-like helical, pumilio domain-
MEPQRNSQMLQNLYAVGPEARFQSMSAPLVVHDGVWTAYDRNQIPDVDESVSNLFSSLNISSPSNFHCRNIIPPVGYDGGVTGAGTGSPIGAGEGSGRHPFRTGIRSSYYTLGGQTSALTVDPQRNYYPLWRNREVGCSVGFDQMFDFDQSFDLLPKEHIYNPHNVSRSVNVSVLCLKELRGKVYALAKDQNGCRLLQAKFENPSDEEVEFVLYEVLEYISELMKDQFGNYLIQKLITVCNDDHKLRMLLSLTDVPVEMVLVCMNPHGTRAMQKLLENLTDPYHIALAMAALRPGAARLASDPNGHHVIQYCLIHFPSDVIEPILNEIADKCYEVATDRSGCCVLQACMEHSHGKVRNRLVAEILGNAVVLAEDPYGNYVLQHMVGLKVPEFTARLVRQLQGNFASLSCNKYASNVVEKCLNESSEDISRQIVMELITCSNPALLLIDPYANFVIQSALTVSTGHVYNYLLELISDNMSSMRTNLYGKKILSWFEKRRILAI